MKDNKRIHQILDDGFRSDEPSEEPGLELYREPLALLEDHRPTAPDDLLARIMGALPDHPEPSRGWGKWKSWFAPRPLPWLAPLAGAAAALILYIGVGHIIPSTVDSRVAVRFELHAPQAEKVELVGTFNNWKPGDILLLGPDPSGHWTATVEVPAGRHEYMFLVDGTEWLTDPHAQAHRPDGFGRENALLEL